MEYKITIKLEDNKVNQKIDEIKGKLAGVEGNRITRFSADTQPLLGSLSQIGMVLAGFNSGIQITQGALRSLGNAVINPAADFETLRVRLVNLYQDTDKASQVFEQFKVIAATTPFELKNVVEAGASLKAFGMNAEETLKPITDLAAYMNVDVVDAASAVGRAFAGGAGAADILRERGVLELIKSFKGIDDLTKLTLPEFRQAMLDTFESPASGIAGATDKLSQTYTGAMSNMKDALTNFSATVGSSLTPVLSSLARGFTDFITSITPVKTELEKVTDETINQQAEFSSLVSVYKILRFEQNETVTSNSTLKEIVDQLNKNYKSYIGNIDLATASYNEFQLAVSKANDELIREAQIKLVNAEKSDLASKVSKIEYERRTKIVDIEKDISNLDNKLIEAQKHLLQVQQQYEKAKATNQAHLFSASVEQASKVFDSYEKSIEDKHNRIRSINNNSKKEMEETQKELDEFTRTWADMISKATDSPNNSDKDTKTGSSGIDDKLKKELESLRRSLKDKEELLKEDYETNRQFILSSVKDKEEQTKLLSALNMKYSNDYADLKKSENQSIKNSNEEQLKLHQELEKEKLEIVNESAKRQYEIDQEKQAAYDEYLNLQYEMTTSAEERRIQAINMFYGQYKNVLISMGVTETQLENQRIARIAQASETYRGFTSFIESGFDNLWSNIDNKSMNTKERWDSVWKSMRATGLKALGDIIKQKIADGIKTTALYKAETAAHGEKEATKTSFSLFGAIQRGAIATGEFLKETALTVASGIKYIAVQLWKIGASFFRFFTSIFGPLGIPMAIASTVAVGAIINSMRKGFALGGYTGDGDRLEVAGVVHKKEIVMESGITKNNKNELLGLRSLLQKGYRLKDLLLPQISFPVMATGSSGGGYANGGYVSDNFINSNISLLLDTISKKLDKLDVLNKNLVDKDFNALVFGQNQSSLQSVRQIRRMTKKLETRGEV